MTRIRQYPFFDPEQADRLRGRRLSSRRPVTGPSGGIHSSRHRGFAADFAEHRPYVPGDDLRYLDWKVFGRSDKQYVRQYEDDRNRPCYLVLDGSGSMAYHSTLAPVSKHAFAQACLSYLAWIALEQGDPTALICVGTDVGDVLPPSSQPAHFFRILERLDQASPEGTTQFKPALEILAVRLRQRGLVVLVSDMWSDLESLMSGLTRLRAVGHDIWLVHVMDRAEWEFPFGRQCRFRGLEGEAALTANASSLAPFYRHAVREFCRRLETLCRSRNIPYHRVMTDQDAPEVIRLLTACRAGVSPAGGSRDGRTATKGLNDA